MEKIIFNKLAGLIGGKVYPLLAPEQISTPYIVYQKVSTAPENTIDGGSSVDLLRMQIDVYADTYAQTKTLAQQVRSALETGENRATLQSEIDLFEPDLRIYRASQDFYFWKRSSI